MSDLKEFKEEDYPDRVCCGVLEWIVDAGYAFPFQRPIIINEDRQLVPGGWSAQCFKKTPKGDISRKENIHFFLTYCPFCGKELSASE
jgi:hypothetical protein